MAEEKSVEEKEVTEVKVPAVKAKKAPAKKVKAEPKAQNVVDIADFFTTTREKEGVWTSIEIAEQKFPLEFKLLGPASDKYIKASQVYDGAHDTVVKTEDDALAVELERQAVCNFISSVVIDFRPLGNIVPVVKGKELKYTQENMYKILYESIEIRSALYAALLSSSTFHKH